MIDNQGVISLFLLYTYSNRLPGSFTTDPLSGRWGNVTPDGVSGGIEAGEEISQDVSNYLNFLRRVP
ncbi:MAG: hypothetical protein WC291_09010 [Thermodesulfovibrionales bacterium]|jgi:hypothetical protein